MKKHRILIISLIAAVLVIGGLYFFNSRGEPENRDGNMTAPGTESQEENNDITVIKVAHCFPESHPQHMALIEKFVPMIEKESGWKIRVEVYPNSQLGIESDIIQGVRNGVVEMCITEGRELSDIWAKLRLLKMPYLFDSYDQAGEMLNGTLGSEMVKGMETAGIQCLAWSLNGFYQISTFYNQPLRQEVPQNFKVVSSNSGRNIEALNAIGFSAVPLKIEGNWLNVSQYQFDGYDNIPLDTYYNGWDLRQRYLFITNHILSTGMYAVSSRFWDTLPKEHKDLVSKAAKAAAEYEIELYKTEEKDVFEFIKGKGIIIARPDLTHFKNAASLKYKDWIENGSELKRIFELYMKEKESI